MYLIKLAFLAVANLVKQALLIPQGTRSRAANPDACRSRASAPRRRAYQFLMVVFGVAGMAWIIHGLMTPRWVLYPLVGLVNLGIAFLCLWSSGSH